MLFERVAVLQEDFSVAYGMDVRTDDAHIVSIAKNSGAAGSGSSRHAEHRAAGTVRGAERIIDGRGKLLMSGFYNLHTHAPMTLMRGYGEGLPLIDWLERKIFPFESRLTGEDCYSATLLSMAESFAQGIVSSSDQYFFCEDIVRAISESGAKMNASRGLSFFDDTLNLSEFRPYQESRKLFETYHGARDGRIRVDIGLHGEYTATAALIEAAAGLSHETGAPVHAHISETRGEHEGCKARNNGKTPMRLFVDAGLYDNGGLAAHCVWIEEEDADIMKEKGITAVTCPVSNMKLASGIAPVPLLFEKGVRVALGTDGVASNNSLNFFEEIKLMSLSAKIRSGDSTQISPAEALYAATRAGALAQGRPDCGFVKEGFRADMILIDLDSPSLHPVYDILNNLVFAAGSRDILMTIVDGCIVYENGVFPTIDLERVNNETESIRKRILAGLGGCVE